MTNEIAHMAQEADTGERLDRFLARRLGVGLRASRRMIEGGYVRVSGNIRPTSWKMRPDEIVTVAEPFLRDIGVVENVAGQTETADSGVRLLANTDRYAALFKPSGVHTAALAGGGGASLESLLSVLLPDSGAVLVNRLDRDTSGIVLAAFGPDNAQRFRNFEDAGKVDKRYFALVAGRVEKSLNLSWGLDTADRAKVKVLEAPTTDPLRVTRIVPIAVFPDSTLVEAHIAKGARHQIRAHLSRAGHPILGDSVYGRPDCTGLKLHHWRCSFQGFSANCQPYWHDMPKILEAAAAFASTVEEPPCGQ